MFALIALAFVAYAAWQLAQRWQGSRVEPSWLLCAASIAPVVAGAVILAWGWKLLLERITGRTVVSGHALALHVESQLARYVPGKVGVPLLRMAGGASIGVSARVVGSSILIEMLSFLAVGGATGIGLLLLMRGPADGPWAGLGPWGVPMLVAMAVAIAALLAVDRDRLPRQLLDKLRLDGNGPLVPAQVPLIHAAYWATWALHGYLVSRAGGAGHDVALASAGLYVLAPIVGFLALAAPAGVGVREAMISFGLAHAVGPEAALAAAGISRAATLLADVGAWLALRPLRAPRRAC